MAITKETTIARADVDDEYGVTIWQHRKLVHYTPGEAIALAEEIRKAAASAVAMEREDQQRPPREVPLYPFDIDMPAGVAPFNGRPANWRASE